MPYESLQVIFDFQFREPHPHSGRVRCRDNKGRGFPVASIGRIVVVIVVFVVHGQFVQVLTSELAPTSPTHPRVNLERLCPIVALAGIAVPDGLGDNSIQIFF